MVTNDDVYDSVQRRGGELTTVAPCSLALLPCGGVLVRESTRLLVFRSLDLRLHWIALVVRVAMHSRRCGVGRGCGRVPLLRATDAHVDLV